MTNNAEVKEAPPALKKMFLPGGCIAVKLENYEERPQQTAMALAIESVLAEEKHLVVEAGTGVGKSLAYLAPLILWAVKKKKKAVVATYTKTLQEQLIKKELPFLEKSLKDENGQPIKFKFALCLGSGNYLCLRRFNRGRQFGLFENFSKLEEWDKIASWSRETKTGIKMDAEFPISNDVWAEVSREPDLCFGRKCPYIGVCFFSRARSLQAKADILVANHHLFFTDIASEGRVLPAHEVVVFDEAHNVEDVATDYLGAEASNTGIEWLLSKIYNPSTGKGIITRTEELNAERITEIKRAVQRAGRQGRRLFNLILEKFPGAPLTKRIRESGLFDNTLEESLENLCLILKSAASEIKDEENALEIFAYAGRCAAMKKAIKIFMEQSEKDFVYWIDVREKRRGLKVSLVSAPVEVAKNLREKLYEKKPSVIMTSASLSVNRNFSYIKERLGLQKAEELLLDSPFDYGRQALLYIAEDLPDPSYEPAKFTEEAAKRCGEILKISGGGTFILFTSYSSLDKTYEYLESNIKNIHLLKQTGSGEWNMLETFKNGPASALLGTNTFWQGVDIPGDALRCVVIFKLPFAAPDSPVIEARIEFLRKKGVDAFRHYQIPRAALMLKQGVGRLIRSKTDTGVIAILDPRLISRGYGKYFTKTLPDCALAAGIDDIRKFLDDGGAADTLKGATSERIKKTL